MVNWRKLRSSIPSSVHIGKQLYEIVFIDQFLDPHTLGETRFEGKRQIVIKNGLTPKETVKVYFHELIHAFSEEFNAEMTETQVLAMEKGLHWWMKRDNIFEKDKRRRNASNTRKRKTTRKIRRTRS